MRELIEYADVCIKEKGGREAALGLDDDESDEEDSENNKTGTGTGKRSGTESGTQSDEDDDGTMKRSTGDDEDDGAFGTMVKTKNNTSSYRPAYLDLCKSFAANKDVCTLLPLLPPFQLSLLLLFTLILMSRFLLLLPSFLQYGEFSLGELEKLLAETEKEEEREIANVKSKYEKQKAQLLVALEKSRHEEKTKQAAKGKK
jgi:hypothetical protein